MRLPSVVVPSLAADAARAPNVRRRTYMRVEPRYFECVPALRRRALHRWKRTYGRFHAYGPRRGRDEVQAAGPRLGDGATLCRSYARARGCLAEPGRRLEGTRR